MAKLASPNPPTPAQGDSHTSRVFPFPRRAHRLVRLLAGQHNILVTTHEHPDPDALAACIGMRELLSQLLPHAEVTVSFKGRIGGGLNSIFAQYSGHHVEAWDLEALPSHDAIVLVDCQPTFSHSPLPAGINATAVVDHHPTVRGKAYTAAFIDVRRHVGASCSIVYGYFHEMGMTVPKDVSALMLFGIESDLAGVAGTPGKLDNLAISSLFLSADARAYHAIRYVDLPRSYYISFYRALRSAVLYGRALTSFLGEVDSPEQPAVMADMLLRSESVDWALVMGVHEGSLLLSLRTFKPERPAGKIMTRLVRRLGEGGGHPTKAGGSIPLTPGSEDEIRRHLELVRRRLLRSLKIRGERATPLVPDAEVQAR
jgi:nanoRNase/pAp phosphatase (c-di-AMP/oligoRNAs hydrolase)